MKKESIKRLIEALEDKMRLDDEIRQHYAKKDKMSGDEWQRYVELCYDIQVESETINYLCTRLYKMEISI